MRLFNKGKKSGKKPGNNKGKKGFKRQSSGFGNSFDKRDYDRPKGHEGRTDLFSAVCAECGEHCTVPFKPTGSRPVLCRRCFQLREGGNGAERFNDRGYTRNFKERFHGKRTDGSSSDQLAEINRKLDLIMEALDIE